MSRRERLPELLDRVSLWADRAGAEDVVMAPRPGRIAEEVRITAPAERGEEFRTSPEYAAQCRTVSHALSSAMGGAHE